MSMLKPLAFISAGVVLFFPTRTVASDSQQILRRSLFKKGVQVGLSWNPYSILAPILQHPELSIVAMRSGKRTHVKSCLVKQLDKHMQSVAYAKRWSVFSLAFINRIAIEEHVHQILSKNRTVWDVLPWSTVMELPL